MNFNDYGTLKSRENMFGSTKLSMDASELVYANLVVPKYLPEFGVYDVTVKTPLEWYALDRADSKMAMDHIWEDEVVHDATGISISEHGKHIRSIQTRFRAPKYGKYDDFTIRYDNPNATSYTGETVKCEYNHLFADIFFYGICDYDLTEGHWDNSKKPGVFVNTGAKKVTKLNKWVMVDLNVFKQLLKEGKIVVLEEPPKGHYPGDSYEKDGILYSVLQKNSGAKDTRFVAFNISVIRNKFPEMIMKEYGYKPE